MERKDAGHGSTYEVVPPALTGKKAVVLLKVGVMVEVNESDDWTHMVNQAKDEVARRVVDSKIFYPYSAEVEALHTDMEVDDLRYRTYVPASKRL